MSRFDPLARRLHKVFEPTPRGVVGAVDELLLLCHDHPLQLEWRDGACHVQPGPVEVPLPKSVFRAVLARLAVLCGGTVSPYGGTAELVTAAGPAYHIEFANTPGEQRLAVRWAGELPKPAAPAPAAAPGVALTSPDPA